MRSLFLLALVAAVCTFTPSLAQAQLYPAFADGGSLARQTDGGAFITVDTGHTTNWTASLRCSSRLTSPRAYYRFSADAGTATTVDPLLDLDSTKTLEIVQSVTSTRDVRNRWLSFTGEDGGQPACNVWQDTIP